MNCDGDRPHISLYEADDEPFTNYGDDGNSLYFAAEIAKMGIVPRATVARLCRKLSDNDVIKNCEITIHKKYGDNDMTSRSKVTLVTRDGLRKVLCMSRSPIPQHILDYYEISEYNKFQCDELKVTLALMRAFPDITILTQYPIEEYKVDAYIPDHEIVVEIDEFSHRDYNSNSERIRELTIVNFLEKKSKNGRQAILRFDPYGSNKNIFDLIAEIRFALGENRS